MQQSLDSSSTTHSHLPPPTLKFPCLKSYTQNLTNSTSSEVAFIQRKGAGYLTVELKEEIWRLIFLNGLSNNNPPAFQSYQHWQLQIPHVFMQPKLFCYRSLTPTQLRFNFLLSAFIHLLCCHLYCFSLLLLIHDLKKITLLSFYWNFRMKHGIKCVYHTQPQISTSTFYSKSLHIDNCWYIFCDLKINLKLSPYNLK